MVENTEKINFSDLFSDFTLIFPESRDSAWFGKKIFQIEKYEDKLFLLNQTNSGKNILCFNTCGQFLFNIDNTGRGPGEYNSLINFTIDRNNKRLILHTVGNKYGFNEYMLFDLNGNYLFSEKLKNYENEINRSLVDYNEDIFVAFGDKKEFGTDMAIMSVIDRDSFTILDSKSAIYPNSVMARVPINHLYSGKNQKGFYFYQSDTIFQLMPDFSVAPKFSVNYGNKYRNFKENLAKKSYDKEALEFLREKVKQSEAVYIQSFLINEHWFSIHYSTYVKEVYSFVTAFYDCKNNKSYNTENINFDILNLQRNRNMHLCGSADGYFYAVLTDPLSKSFSEEEMSEIAKSKFLDDNTKQKLLNVNEESNPIILQFR
jgi:hypothetical protein